jgi:hypothetical protein
VAGCKPQPCAVVLEYRQTAGFGLLYGAWDAAGFGKLAREVVILSEKVTMVLSRILPAANGLDDVLAIEHPDKPVDPRRVGQQLRLVTLHEAPGHDHALTSPGGLEIDGLTDLGKGLSLRRFKKSTCVDDNGVGVAGIRRDRQSILCQQPEHALAVHKILGTSKTYKRHRFDWPVRTPHVNSAGDDATRL